MARPIHVVLPGRRDTPTGGFVYDRHMIDALGDAGRLGRVVELPDQFPHPPPAVAASAARALDDLGDDAPLLVDGLCLAPLGHVFGRHATLRPLYALIHHPLCDEAGLGAGERADLFVAERQALALARGVVVTSATTARRLADFAVPAARIRVVRPGVEIRVGRGGKAGRRAPGRPPHLLSVASLTPRKGQDRLLRALAPLRAIRWRLTLVGAERDARFARRLRRLIRDLGFADRVRVTGAVPATVLDRLFRDAAVFVLASRHEGYGMAVAEAAARRLPIVACDAGAVREAAPPWARLVPPDDMPALTAALRRALVRPADTPLTTSPESWMPRSWGAAEAEFVAALADLEDQ
jgi:glycosyltransferase involved in cell wall biosynthesis